MMKSARLQLTEESNKVHTVMQQRSHARASVEGYCAVRKNEKKGIVTWTVKAVSSPCRAEPSRAGPGRATLVATQRCGKHLSAALPW
jgi:hypothetical protein